MARMQRMRDKMAGLLFSAVMRPRALALWDKAALSAMARQGTAIPCPYCGGGHAETVHEWAVDSQFGLFDTHQDNLARLYLLGASLWPKRRLAAYRKAMEGWIGGRSRLVYRRCRDCDLVYQNFPHTPQSVKFYHERLYRLEWEWRRAETGEPVYGRDDERWRAQQSAIVDYFLSASGLPPGARVLDAGCAEGWTCKFFEQRGYESHGVEPSTPMANYARLHLGQDRVVAADYLPQTYSEAFFDGIVSHHVAEHVPGIDTFFSALARHLRPGGLLYLQTPCMDSLETLKDREDTLYGGHIYCFSQRFLSRLLSKHGFEILDVKLTPCDLDRLDPEARGPYQTSAWADDPGGISIMARRR